MPRPMWQQVSALLLGTMLFTCASPGWAGREDRADRVDRNADRDSTRAAERAERDSIRSHEENTRAETRAAESSARSEADAAERSARASADAARAETDAAERAAREAVDAQEQTAKDAADAAEQAAKDAADAAEDAAKAAEDAARDAREAGEEAAASDMRDLVAEESPEADDRGFPVRRGEVVALDLSDAARDWALSNGFSVIGVVSIPSLNSAVTRLAVPNGVAVGDGLARLRRVAPSDIFDLSHYYGSEIGLAGGRNRMAVAMPRRSVARANAALRIGMIDTGVSSHPSLERVTFFARDFGSPQAARAHGTAVASLLARDGASQIVTANVFRGQGQRQFTTPEALIEALGWMVDQRVAVINISLSGPRNIILDRLIGRAIDQGHLIVAAAGNGGPTAPPAYPAAVPGVVAVTAVDSQRRVYRYANQGNYIALAALGVDVPAAAAGGSFVQHSGTSFAAPHVATALARGASTVSRQNLECIARLESRAIDLGAPGRDPVYGIGLID